MPELPDIVIYLEALEQRVLNQTLERVQLATPFLLRTAVPPLSSVEGRKVIALRRLGKRICFGLEGEQWLVLHLMIAGRLHWHPGPIKLSRSPKNRGLAAFQFSNGTLSLTEAGSQRRASLHLVEGEDGLQRMDPGGLEVFEIDERRFAEVLTSANHTLKRALTDPRLFSGIGNAYSDEILFATALADRAHTETYAGPDSALVYRHARDAHEMGRFVARGSRRKISGKSNCVPKGHGGSRPVPRAVRPLWREDPANSLRRKRNELLSGVSDGRKASGRPRAFTSVACGLAPYR